MGYKGIRKKIKADYAIKVNIKSWLKKEPNIAIEEIANRLKKRRIKITA